MHLSSSYFIFLISLSLCVSIQARPPRKLVTTPSNKNENPTNHISTTDPNVIRNKPMMGWNPYNVYGCAMDEARATSNLNDFANSGLIGLGYNHFSVDCGWIDKNRDAVTNSISDNKGLWPSGIAAFGKQVKSKQMRFGLSASIGVNDCGSSADNLKPGSNNHEDVDAKTLANFGAEYVKLSNCFYRPDQSDSTIPQDDFDSRFAMMSSSLAANGIKEVIIDELGVPFINKTDGRIEGPEEWAYRYGTSYRVADNIAAGNGAPTGWNEILRIINQAIHISAKDGASGPGQYADLDLLAVGNDGLTYDEQCTHYAFWALFKSPLMISMDLSKLQEEKYSWILTRKELIAANQDLGGKPIRLIERVTDSYDLFAGPLSNNEVVVFVIDYSNEKGWINVVLSRFGVDSADVIDMWTEERYNNIKGVFKGSIQAHGCMALKLVNIQKNNVAPSYKWYPASLGILSDGAQLKSCSGCVGDSKVGNLIGNAAVTIKGVSAKSEMQFVNIEYINAEIHYAGSAIPNIRGAYFSVNGGDQQLVKMPISSYNWDTPAQFFTVALSGFHKGEGNNIQIKAAPEVSPFAPDIVRIGVQNTILT